MNLFTKLAVYEGYVTKNETVNTIDYFAIIKDEKSSIDSIFLSTSELFKEGDNAFAGSHLENIDMSIGETLFESFTPNMTFQTLM